MFCGKPYINIVYQHIKYINNYIYNNIYINM